MFLLEEVEKKSGKSHPWSRVPGSSPRMTVIVDLLVKPEDDGASPMSSYLILGRACPVRMHFFATMVNLRSRHASTLLFGEGQDALSRLVSSS